MIFVSFWVSGFNIWLQCTFVIIQFQYVATKDLEKFQNMWTTWRKNSRKNQQQKNFICSRAYIYQPKKEVSPKTGDFTHVRRRRSEKNMKWATAACLWTASVVWLSILLSRLYLRCGDYWTAFVGACHQCLALLGFYLQVWSKLLFLGGLHSPCDSYSFPANV